MSAAPHLDERRLYAWQVTGAGRGACGVTDHFGAAARRFAAALRAIPEGAGSIHAVWLDVLANPQGYAYGRVLAQGRGHKITGGIVMQDDKDAAH
jgi:hypothetical protein